MALIVVAEDNESIRTMIKVALVDSGYHCHVYSNGNEALAALLREEEVSLLITDYRMPSGDGGELMRILRDGPPRFQTLPVIIISGVANEPSLKDYEDDPHCVLLIKPFTIDELTSAIDNILQKP